MNIELNEKQRINLVEFLLRASLRGEEVPAYLELVEILNKPILNPKK